MLNTIVWATDGSENAARALPWARELLGGDDALLVATHIVQPPGGAAAEGAGESSRHPADLLGNLRNLVSEVSEQGLNIALKIVNYVGPQPAQGIADVAREVGADVIVVGTRGRSPIAGLIAGSVTQHLLEIAPCPVLSVPPGAIRRVDEEGAGVACAD